MKRIIITCLITLTTLVGYSQNWQYIGGEGALGNSSEVDIAIGSDGTLYAFYIDGTKGSVKKWNGSAWVLVGLSQFTNNNVADLQIELLEDDYPVVGFKHGASTDKISVRYFNGSSWVDYGGATSYDTSPTKEYSLKVSSNDGIYLTFYDDAGIVGNAGALKTLSLGVSTHSQFGSDLSFDDDDTYYDAHMGSFIDDNEDSWVAFDETDVGSGGTYLKKKNGASYTTYNVSPGDQTNGLETIDLGTHVAVVYSVEPTTNITFKNLNKTVGTFTQASVTGTLTDFELAAGSQVYLFGRNNTSHRIMRYNVAGATPDDTWSNFGPGAVISSPSIAMNGNNPVVAFIEGGQISVMELNVAPTVDYTAESFCVGTSITSDDITVSDPNYDNSNAVVTVTGGGPLSNGTVSGTYPTYNATFDVDMSSSSTGLYGINFVYDGNSYPSNIGLASTPEITFDFPTNEICSNTSVIDLNNHVTPAGGVWEIIGEGVVDGGLLDPSEGTPGNYNLRYTFTSLTGCEGTDIFNFDLYASPIVSVTTTASSCGEDDGTATANIAISTGDSYDVYWSNGDTEEMADSLNPGMYYVNVTTINGCVSMTPASIANNDLTLSANVTPATCYGEASGSIDLSISGVGSDFSIYWSNGATTEDVTDLLPGPYTVSVEDENGCVASRPFLVGSPDDITWTAGTEVSSCAGGDGLAYCQVVGGTAPYNFQWFDSDGTAVGNDNDSLENISGGFYQVLITDAAGCTKNWNTTVNETGGPDVTIDSVFNSTCSDDGKIYTTIDAPSGIQEIGWNSGETTEDITDLAPGYYAIWVVDNSGCIGMASQVIDPILPEPVDICLVTVDTNTTTNKIVWEKPVSTTIASFNVYRETSEAGFFQLVDEVLYSEESEFTDPIASPQIRSWRYKIASVDLCGNESELSEDHKTIHLTISQGLGSNVNLHWDNYHGIDYTTYKIWKHDTPSGWQSLVDLPLSSTSYTDIPATEDGLDYMVIIDLGGTCTSSKANDYNSSRSNRATGVFNPDNVSINEEDAAIIQLYPNPSNGQFKLLLDGSGQKQVSIVSSNGKVVYQNQTSSNEVNFNLTNLEVGMYHLIIQGDDQNVMKKIMIK